jgi:hypothetical protein
MAQETKPKYALGRTIYFSLHSSSDLKGNTVSGDLVLDYKRLTLMIVFEEKNRRSFYQGLHLLLKPTSS